ncbi:hypothetical protein [Planctomycetes bacterium K23_9]|uniref:Uncharacterized protein n=1 Tax=Stieleria marina TaxID=1930275 RepID=A0A517NU85_9BACT|nr:hypothetical protein K239x_26380 [Planctomycetes bacterium K23_9]
MPAVDEFSRPSNPPFQDANDHWAIPLGTISGLRLFVSYGVFVAVAVLVGVLVTFRGRSSGGVEISGNGDLMSVAFVGLAFWLVGWLVQLTVYAFYRFAFGVPIESVTIGILGVESRARDWDARTALTVSLSSLFAVVAIGGLIVVAEQFVNGTQPWPRMFSVWSAPSFGLTQADSIWLGGAWLCWVQAICQAYPLPKSTGRVAMVAAVSLLTQRMNESFQIHFSRRSIQLVAFFTILTALAAVARSPVNVSTNWFFIFAIALLLWVSSRADDVRNLVLSFGPFPHWEPTTLAGPLSFQRVKPKRRNPWKALKQTVTSVSHRRQLRQAMRSERQEAVDASRLDAVLEQLHTHGRQALSPQDLALLERMSRNLKKERRADPTAPPTDEGLRS